VPAQFRVIATIRPRYACPKSRVGVVQAPAPAHLIEGGLPTEALLAHVLVGKFADYLPLYRQSQVFARHGVELDRSTLADWVGQAAWHLAPVVDRMAELLKRSGKLFMDETTVPVLAPGRGRTKTGYLWAMARDDRPWNGPDPPGVVFAYAPGRGGHHGERMLAGFDGVLQVDGYGGYRRLTRPERQGGVPLTLALCVAHLRRKILDAKPKAGSPIADDLLARLAELYRIEAEIRGHDADTRRAVRGRRSAPLVDALGETMRAQRARLARSSPMAKALDYGLDHWRGFTVFLARPPPSRRSSPETARRTTRGRKGRAGLEPGGKSDPAPGPYAQEQLVRRSRRGRRQLGPHRLADRHLQDERRRALRLSEDHPRAPRRRPSARPPRRAPPLAL